MSVAGIILAAGESRRMGAPKALLEYRGEPFLGRLTRLFSACCSPVVVVVGAHAEGIPPGHARTVLNPAWQAGQITSLQAGLRALGPCEGVLFTLVDHPAVRAETLDGLLAAPGILRIPRFQGRRGHPVYFDAGLIAEFLAVPATGAARDVVNRHAAEIVYLDVEDPGVVQDIDDPGAYRALLEARP